MSKIDLAQQAKTTYHRGRPRFFGGREVGERAWPSKSLGALFLFIVLNLLYGQDPRKSIHGSKKAVENGRLKPAMDDLYRKQW